MESAANNSEATVSGPCTTDEEPTSLEYSPVGPETGSWTPLTRMPALPCGHVPLGDGPRVAGGSPVSLSVNVPLVGAVIDKTCNKDERDDE